MATPHPVDPSRSRLTSSGRIRSGCRPTGAPALTANSSNNFGLSVTTRSTATSVKFRKSPTFIAIELTVQTLIGSAQSVADAGFGQDVLWPLGVSLDFLAKLTHINPQILGVGQIIP